MTFENETYLGYENGIHLIRFNCESETYIAKMLYDRFKNVQILEIENTCKTFEQEHNYFIFDDIDIDYLECFLFKELLDNKSQK